MPETEQELFASEEVPRQGRSKAFWIIIGIIVVVVIVGISVLRSKDQGPQLTLEGVNTELQGAIVSLNTTMLTLEGAQMDLAHQAENVANIGTRLRDLEQSVSGIPRTDWQPQLDGLATTIEGVRASLTDTVTSLNATVTAIQLDIDLLRDEIEATNNATATSLSALESITSSHTETLADIVSRVEALETAIASIPDFQPQIDTLTSTIHDLDLVVTNTVAALQGTDSTLQAQIDTLTGMIDDLALVVTDMVAALEATDLMLQSQIDDLWVEIDTLHNVSVPYVLVTGIDGTQLTFEVYGLQSGVVVATIYGTNLQGPVASGDTVLGYFGGNETLVVGLAPLDIWTDGSIINLMLTDGSVAFAYASVGG